MKSSNLAKYESKNPLKRFLLSRFLKKIGELILPLKVESILDAGCGEGFTIKYLKSLKLPKELPPSPSTSSGFGEAMPACVPRQARDYGEASKFYGIDLNEAAISEAKKRVSFAEFKVASVYNIPYPPSFFDLVICCEVLEHLEKPEGVLSELSRVSKKYLLLSVPNEPSFSISSLFSGQYISRLGKHPEHVNFWSRKDFVYLVKKYFSIIKVETSFPWTIILCKK